MKKVLRPLGLSPSPQINHAIPISGSEQAPVPAQVRYAELGGRKLGQVGLDVGLGSGEKKYLHQFCRLLANS